MNLRPEEISSVIKEEIKKYSTEFEVANVGTVIQVADGIARIHGLEKAMQGELLEFPHEVYGMVMNLEEDNVGAVLLGDSSKISEGDTVKTTGRVVEVPVGDAMTGRVGNALGQPIDGKGPIETDKFRRIERVAHGVIERKSVDTPLQTGIKAIDAMIPIGRGQRELTVRLVRLRSPLIPLSTRRARAFTVSMLLLARRHLPLQTLLRHWKSLVRWITQPSLFPLHLTRLHYSTSLHTLAVLSVKSGWKMAAMC